MAWQRVGQFFFGLMYTASGLFKLISEGPHVPIRNEMVSVVATYWSTIVCVSVFHFYKLWLKPPGNNNYYHVLGGGLLKS